MESTAVGRFVAAECAVCQQQRTIAVIHSTAVSGVKFVVVVGKVVCEGAVLCGQSGSYISGSQMDSTAPKFGLIAYECTVFQRYGRAGSVDSSSF